MRTALACICSVVIILSLASCEHSAAPRDVEDFIGKRDACDHLRGEIPDESRKEGMQQVLHAIDIYCTGTDKELAALKGKYSHNAAAMEKLGIYETRIEVESEMTDH